MSERKLATIKTIDRILPIEGVDRIEKAIIGGWVSVVPKDEYREGEEVCYFEIDSMLPVEEPQFAFLDVHGNKFAEDSKGRRCVVLRTKKLKGVVSQGLVIHKSDAEDMAEKEFTPGEDVTDALGIEKWEPALPACLGGDVEPFPSWITKTDEERIQNLPEVVEYLAEVGGDGWIATEKIDGTSATFYVGKDDTFGVCSRNYKLKETDDSYNNTLWRMVDKYEIEYTLRVLQVKPGVNTVVIQAECFGEGIQKNPLKIKGQEIRIFNLIINGHHIARKYWLSHISYLKNAFGPWYKGLSIPSTMEEIMEQADTVMSLINPAVKAEGIVWRNSMDMRPIHWNDYIIKPSFKVVSNSYLRKNEG
jgi:RNA ligase (TIGR02306 family)